MNIRVFVALSLGFMLLVSYQNCGQAYGPGDLIEIAYDREPVRLIGKNEVPGAETNMVCVSNYEDNLVIGQFDENGEPDVVCMSYDACVYLTEDQAGAFGPLQDNRCKDGTGNFIEVSDDDLLSNVDAFKSLVSN